MSTHRHVTEAMDALVVVRAGKDLSLKEPHSGILYQAETTLLRIAKGEITDMDPAVFSTLILLAKVYATTINSAVYAYRILNILLEESADES